MQIMQISSLTMHDTKMYEESDSIINKWFVMICFVFYFVGDIFNTNSSVGHTISFQLVYNKAILR